MTFYFKTQNYNQNNQMTYNINLRLQNVDPVSQCSTHKQAPGGPGPCPGPTVVLVPFHQPTKMREKVVLLSPVAPINTYSYAFVNGKPNTRKKIFELKIDPADIMRPFSVVCKRRLGTFPWLGTHIMMFSTLQF